MYILHIPYSHDQLCVRVLPVQGLYLVTPISVDLNTGIIALSSAVLSLPRVSVYSVYFANSIQMIVSPIYNPIIIFSGCFWHCLQWVFLPTVYLRGAAGNEGSLEYIAELT